MKPSGSGMKPSGWQNRNLHLVMSSTSRSHVLPINQSINQSDLTLLLLWLSRAVNTQELATLILKMWVTASDCLTVWIPVFPTPVWWPPCWVSETAKSEVINWLTIHDDQEHADHLSTERQSWYVQFSNTKGEKSQQKSSLANFGETSLRWAQASSWPCSHFGQGVMT